MPKAAKVGYSNLAALEMRRRVLTVATDDGITEQRYDAAGNLLALIEPVGNVTEWVYDALHRVIRETDPLGEAGTVTFDEVGRVTSATDRPTRTCKGLRLPRISRQPGAMLSA